MIEWPRGSGQVARYTEAERAIMRRLLETPGTRKEAELIHALKVEFPGSKLR